MKINHSLRSKIAMLILVGMTLISAFLGWYFKDTDFSQQTWLLWGVWLTVMLKGQQITDVFMELSNAPLLWRGLFLAYVTVLPAILGLIYWL